jgi:hypothetical protein
VPSIVRPILRSCDVAPRLEMYMRATSVLLALLARSAVAFVAQDVSRPLRTRRTLASQPQAAPPPAMSVLAGGAAVGSALFTKYAPLAGVGICNVMFLSPAKAVETARRSRSLGSLNPYPWVAMVGNTAAWTGYGLATRNPFVFCANMPGLLLGLWYTRVAVRCYRAAAVRIEGLPAVANVCGTCQCSAPPRHTRHISA